MTAFHASVYVDAATLADPAQLLAVVDFVRQGLPERARNHGVELVGGPIHMRVLADKTPPPVVVAALRDADVELVLPAAEELVEGRPSPPGMVVAVAPAT